MREWLSGRASPCQGECREFESRFPLHRRNSTFLQKDRLSPVFFAYRSVSPLSRKVLRFFGSVADELLFGSIPDDPLFVFLILLYYLLFIFTKKMTTFSLPRETSLHRNRDASLLSAIPSLRSLRISFPAPSSKLDIFAKRQVVTCLFCLPVGFSSFPKSSALLRERSG